MSFDLNKNMPQGIKQGLTEAKARIEALESLRGATNGVCPLDANGLVPLSSLPSAAKSSKVVANITTRDAISSSDRFEGLRVHVENATSDTTVSLGSAGYILGAGLANSDWVKTYEKESLDVDYSEFFIKSEDTSDSVLEGTTNLYFSNARAKAAAVVNSMSGSESDQAPSVGSVKSYTSDSIANSYKKWVNKAANGVLTSSESKVYYDITSANITLTLPSVGSTDDGQSHVVLNKSTSTKTVTVIGSDSDTIDGSSSLILSPGDYVEFVYQHSGTAWFVKD